MNSPIFRLSFNLIKKLNGFWANRESTVSKLLALKPPSKMASLVSLTLSVASSDLPAIMALAAKSGVSISAAGGKVKKEKKQKDPNAPKKDPNDWINFTQRARAALLASGAELKGFVGQQYCAVLKEKLPMKSVTLADGKTKDAPDYDSITDAEIVARFKSWTPPEQSKAAAAKASSTESSPAPSPAPAVAAEKPKRQWSEAAKAAAAEKRAATKAAKAAPAAGGGAAAVAALSPAKAPSSGSNAAAGANAAHAGEGDITEFAPVKIQGKMYLKNCRGDLLTEEYDWVGRLEGAKINTKFPKPEDLEE